MEKNIRNIRMIERPVMRFTLKKLINAAFLIFMDIKVIGKENIPRERPLLVVGNHFSFLDPLAVIATMPGYPDFIGGTDLPGSPPIFRSIPKLWGIYNVHRGSVSREALNSAENSLRKGRILGIFPEGGSWATVLRPPRPGTALLATRTNSLVLPVGLDGFTDVFPLRPGKRVPVTVRIGKPFGPFNEDIRGREGRKKLDDLGHLIMRKISELIPPEKRGFYSDDPVIRNAAKGTEVYPWDSIVEN